MSSSPGAPSLGQRGVEAVTRRPFRARLLAGQHNRDGNPDAWDGCCCRDSRAACAAPSRVSTTSTRRSAVGGEHVERGGPAPEMLPCRSKLAASRHCGPTTSRTATTQSPRRRPYRAHSSRHESRDRRRPTVRWRNRSRYSPFIAAYASGPRNHRATHGHRAAARTRPGPRSLRGRIAAEKPAPRRMVKSLSRLGSGEKVQLMAMPPRAMRMVAPVRGFSSPQRMGGARPILPPRATCPFGQGTLDRWSVSFPQNGCMLRTEAESVLVVGSDGSVRSGVIIRPSGLPLNVRERNQGSGRRSGTNSPAQKAGSLPASCR